MREEKGEKCTKSELLEHYATANAGDPPQALTAVTTAPSPAQASG